MKTKHDRKVFKRGVIGVSLMSVLLTPVGEAAPPALATAPLASATNAQVKPNLMFIMDNSGSMTQDYTPDYIGNIWDGTWSTSERNCRDSGDDDSGTVYPGVVSGTTRVLDGCVVGDPPYMTAKINSQYYNPEITYFAPVNADGSSKPDQTTFTAVLTDGFNILNTTQLMTSATSVNLTNSYPDRVWCTTQSPTGAQLLDTNVCRKNSDYLYPDATFKYGRSSGDPNVQVTQSMLSNVLKVSGAPYYYTIVPTEYCDSADLTNCVLAGAPTGAYIFPAYSRWCTNGTLSNCQAIRTSSYTYPRYIGLGANIAATGSMTLSGFSSSKSCSSIKVGSVEILGATVSGSTPTNLATAIKNQINTFASSPDYTATSSSGKVSITAALAAGASGNGAITWTCTSGVTVAKVDMAGGATASTVPPYTFSRIDIVPAVNSYPKAASRTDCGGPTCTYADEMKNFANWYAYYRTRFQSMKSAVSRAFKNIDARYRVGFVAINSRSSTFLKIADFTGAQRTNWYAKLFAASNAGSTPLRTALADVGRMYAGKKPSGMNDDPVQYACQNNFALMTTDGYWNTDSDASVLKIDGASMTNQDGSADRPYYEGPTASAASLADVAFYYYNTDLRDPDFSNCTGALGLNVCQDGTGSNVNYPVQRMVTFTLGLGVDGTLRYQNDYQTATSGDYYKLKSGIGGVNWPQPVADTETAVDDLWHAAVNGRGKYFSAKNPQDVVTGLTDALSQVAAKVASAAAAATSNLTPVAGDNFVYFPSYTTVQWTGNLEARGVNINTGSISKNASWCVEDIVAEVCTGTGSSTVVTTSGATTTYKCVVPAASAADCVGTTWDAGTSTCQKDLAVACTGKMRPRVAANSDTRQIYTVKSSALVDFTYANVPPAYFNASVVANLSQWSTLTAAQQTAAAGANLVNYLRGQTGYEMVDSNPADNRIFRARSAIFGDVLQSKPVHVGEPWFQYSDPGYNDFRTAQKTRAKTIYIGSNDGMMHAFNAGDGSERWAFVPSAVVKNMWKLADKNYSTMHTNFVNGPHVVGDACFASDCSTATQSDWRTILIGGLGQGGIGYYALDVTDPSAPKFLWEFGEAQDANLAYSFGNPVITKLQSGKWVVMLTSGYYNKPDSSSPTTPAAGNGHGYLYVLDAKTGAKLLTIDTGVGTTTDPAGLSGIAAWADYPLVNNTTTYTYGGDLLGNVWRFDINASLAADRVMKYAELKDSSGMPQPIMTEPELGAVSKKRIVFVGTGKYIEPLDLATTQQNSIYAIQDASGASFSTPLATTTFVNPRTSSAMVKQTLTNSGLTERTVSSATVDWTTKRGWYVDLPDVGERVNVNPKLVASALIAPTTVPEATVCSPGGYGWVNYLNYLTGSLVTGNTIAGEKFTSPPVGISTVYVKCEGCGNYTPVVNVGTADADLAKGKVTPPLGAGKFQKRRLIWRELIPQ